MGELDDCLDRLRRPFPVERRMGFRNMSVMGGFHRYVLQWAKKGRTAASDDRLASNLDHLCTLFLHYDEESIPERRRLLDRGEEILGSLKPPSDKTTTVPAPLQVLPEKKPVRKERPNTTTLESPVQYAKGVGPALAGKLERLSIRMVDDLFFHFPRRYEDRSRLCFLRDVQDGAWATVSATVQGVSEVRPRGGLVITKVAVSDGTANAFLVWYNQPHVKKSFKQGMTIVASGKADKRFREIQIQTPEYEILDGTDSLHTGRIVPIYPLTENLSQTTLRRIIKENLERHGEKIPENLPDDLTASRQLLDRDVAFRAIHFPSSWEELEKARFRLVFEEFFFLQVIIALKAKVAIEHKRPRKYGLTGDPIEKFQEKLPFQLTGAQKRVMEEILADFSEDRLMNRLLQGDVGSGKTVVCAFAAHQVIQEGYQAAVMVPTELIASQHCAAFQRLLAPGGVRVGLLVGGQARKEREQILCGIREGELDLIVGTHALIQEGVDFRNLALVVVDEQHKFGVVQRTLLRQKGIHPDVLFMTATPIPRTLALTLYGDLNSSVLDEMPPGRKPVKTFWRPFSKEKEVYRFIREQVGKGCQVYIVCPLVEESDKIQVASAIFESSRLAEEVFPDLRVALLHGRMKSSEKDAVMQRFRNKEYDLLISTTVIEVGVDIQSATVMVILHADRFGLAQLHQLRGRVGRGSDQSYCVLLATPGSREARDRMELLCRSSDGFVIAEEDLAVRGPGEIYGTRQHGLPDLRIANLVKDAVILEAARKEAFLRIREDPEIAAPGNRRWLAYLEKKYPGAVEVIH